MGLVVCPKLVCPLDSVQSQTLDPCCFELLEIAINYYLQAARAIRPRSLSSEIIDYDFSSAFHYIVDQGRYREPLPTQRENENGEGKGESDNFDFVPQLS